LICYDICQGSNQDTLSEPSRCIIGLY